MMLTVGPAWGCFRVDHFKQAEVDLFWLAPRVLLDAPIRRQKALYVSQPDTIQRTLPVGLHVDRFYACKLKY